MKLRTGRSTYPLPKHSQILLVLIEGNQKHNQGIDFALRPISLSDMDEVSKQKIRAIPTVFTIIHGRIEFWPVPSKPYKVRVRYVPPIMEC
jgi:hypothetical protein